jgi:hypothetical protein
VDAVEIMRGDAVVGDVLEGTADGALEHETAKTSNMVATVDGGLHYVGDRVNHGIHGRYGVRHLLPWVTVMPVKSPVNSLFSLGFSASAV